MACKRNSAAVLPLFCGNPRCTPSLLNMKNKRKRTALMEAIYYGSLDCVRLLDEMEGVVWSAKSVEWNISLISWARKSSSQAANVSSFTREAIFRIIELRNPEQALREYTKYSEDGVRRILHDTSSQNTKEKLILAVCVVSKQLTKVV